MKVAIRGILVAGVLVATQTSAAAAHPGGRGDGSRVLAAPNFDVPAAELRIALDSTLAQHAFLLGEAIRAGLGDGQGFDEVGVALEENTVELEGLVESVYGGAAGAQFGELWRSHVSYLIDYTRALEADDEGAQQLAEEQLHTYVSDFSTFLASANPNLPPAVVEGLVAEHVDQLEAIAAFDAGNYDEAYPAVSETYNHMFRIGDALSEAIALQFPERFTGKSLAFSPAGDLRITLDRLLGEHTVLAVTVMRAGVTEAQDEDAARDALQSNTEALGAAIGEIYGDGAGDAFVDHWTTHTDAYLDYVAGTVASDAVRKEAALAQLAVYRRQFSRFLAEANPQLSAAALESMLEHHTQQLVDQVDAFVAEDYAEAYAVALDAFDHAIEMGDALALAIAGQFPDMFPDTTAAAPTDDSSDPWLVGGVALLLAAVAAALRLRRRAVFP